MAKIVQCRNCKRDIELKIRRCPYCGILNPTVTVKEVITTTLIIIVVMFILTQVVQ